MHNTKSILIFEDDIDLASQWSETFKEKGLKVHHAITVDEAVTYCNQIQFDAIVMDIFLADKVGNLLPKGGLTLMSYLRNTSLEKVPAWGATVPVIVVTAANATFGFDPLLNAKAVGGSKAVEVLRKPFLPKLLYSKIMKLLEDSV